MTGSKNFGCTDNSMSFKLGRNQGNITHVKITLNCMDTYDMIFYKIRGASFKEVAKVDGVYNDMLVDIFTQHTGLETHL